MSLHRSDLPQAILDILFEGAVIPAHPLAVTPERALDTRRQRALARYYLDAGSGGLAVGVHSTQFAIRDVGLYEPVLALAAQTVADWTDDPKLMIAGLAGGTEQAVSEAQTAVRLGYHAGLLSLAAMKGSTVDELIDHCRRVADEIPLVGFYLQPAVGGIPLPADFWRRFAEIDNALAIKAAPFNRYATNDVVRGIVEAGAEDRIALYTGNDDHIVLDLLTPYVSLRNGEQVSLRIRGGLLGQWSVWTERAVWLLGEIKTAIATGNVTPQLLALDSKMTDCNRAIFDAPNSFAGVLPGCHEILRRQGLLENILCLDPDETLSPGQMEEIDRIYAGYPELTDNAFVAENLERWLGD